MGVTSITFINPFTQNKRKREPTIHEVQYLEVIQQTEGCVLPRVYIYKIHPLKKTDECSAYVVDVDVAVVEEEEERIMSPT